MRLVVGGRISCSPGPFGPGSGCHCRTCRPVACSTRPTVSATASSSGPRGFGTGSSGSASSSGYAYAGLGPSSRAYYGTSGHDGFQGSAGCSSPGPSVPDGCSSCHCRANARGRCSSVRRCPGIRWRKPVSQMHPGGPPPDRRWGRNYKQQTPGATTFEDYRRSRFVWTEDDAISTFSLDTDRTSYHLALNWARSGYEVDPDSVRAEEWINSFNFGYDMPSNRDSFAMSTDVMKHPLYERTYLVRLGFQAPELRDEKPVNVTLVLDASGSMGDGNRVDIAREAAESIRRSLGDRDRIGVVHFTTDVIHEYTVKHRRPDHEDVWRSISQLTPHGSTNVQAGLDLGVRMADRMRRERPDAYNYIILMSDGVANVDATDPFAILESASDRDSGNPLRLITIGVGINNYNDYLLEQLAQYGNGWYRYLSTTDQARATFGRENWLALSVPFADQTRAQVTWDPAMVATWRMIGYENRITSDESFTENRKEFAEIPVGAATTVFYEVELTHEGEWAADSKLVQIGDVELRWVTPTDGTSNRQEGVIMADLGSGTDPLMRFGAVVALSSDRYSSLPHIDDRDSAYVRRDLSTLMEELWPLESSLGSLDSYRDFKFLLRHITDSLPESIGSTQRSGYSP